MLGQIILISIGSVHMTLRGLFLLLVLAAYAGVCLYTAPQKGVRRDKAALALMCGYAGLFLFSRGFYLLLERNLPSSVLSAGECVFAGLVGFFAGVRLYCLHSRKAFKRLLRFFAPPFFALAACLYLLRDGEGGIVAAHGGLFRYADVYAQARWNAPLIQGTLILLMMAAAFAAQALTSRPKQQPERGAQQKKRAAGPLRFKIRLLPMTICALSLVLPMELLRDTTQRRLLGAPLEALMIWLCLMTLMTARVLQKLGKKEMALNLFLLNAASSLLLPLLSVFTLAGNSALICLILTAVPAFVTFSPLFPFIKRLPRRATKRKFS